METQEQFTFDIDGARLGWFFLTRFLWSVKFSGGHWLLYTLLLSVWFVLLLASLAFEPVLLVVFGLFQLLKWIIKPIYRVLALPLAFVIIYALYTSGKWHELYYLLSRLLSESTF